MQTGVEFTVVEMGNGVFRFQDTERISGDPMVPPEAVEVDLGYVGWRGALEDACRLAGVEFNKVELWKAYSWSKAGATAHVIAVRCAERMPPELPGDRLSDAK